MTQLRDRCLHRLRAATGLSRRELRALRCSDIEQRPHSGELYLSLGERPQRRMLELSSDAQTALLDWLEAARSWSQPRPLFTVGPGGAPLSLPGVILALRRGRSESTREGTREAAA